jgi:hypothetical protein
MHIVRNFAFVLALNLTAASHVPAQEAAPVPPGPPPPDKYIATVRYRILTLRDTHVAQYDALIAHLKKLNFEFIPPLEDHPETDREDRTKNEITGLVPSENVRKIFENPHVAGIMLVPRTFLIPADPDRQVHVRLELTSGLSPDLQFQLSQQVRLQLGLIGFREAPGYDHRGYSGKPYTRIVGVVPVSQLSLLLRDLRLLPTDWFDTKVPISELPTPLRYTSPILVTEVLPDTGPLNDLPVVPARNPAYLERIAPDLWDKVAKKEPGVVRIQMIVIGSPTFPKYDELRYRMQQAASSLIVEGQLGPVVTGTVFVEDVPKLAAIPEVSALRLAQYRALNVDPKTKSSDNKQRALELSGLADLHKLGFRGNGVRLAILDTDFRGWDKLVAEKKLPAKTLYVDLAMIPDDPQPSVPITGDPKEIGHGSHCALAAALAAPEAELVLVRIAGADPYQMVEAVQYFRGDFFTDAVNRRRDELLLQRQQLTLLREVLLKERPDMIKDFADEKELEMNFGFLGGPVFGWIFSKRQLHFQQMDYQRKLDTELAEQFGRFLKMTEGLEKLKGIKLVATAINWPDRYPLGASEISRWLHLQKRDKLLWFQSAGNNRGQAWTGTFRDADKNGVMEFADLKTPIKKGRWTHEINFLGWQPYEGGQVPDLPAQARVRVSLQWREPHDPDYYFRPGEQDYYLRPLATLQLNVLRQRDPTLKLLPADSFQAVGSTAGYLPARLLHLPSHTIYEHSVEFTTDRAAPFAVQIERLLPSRWVLREDRFDGLPRFLQLKNLVPITMRPLGVPILPQLERNWELRVRLYVEVLDDVTRPLGRPVFADYATDEGSMGQPADSLGAFTIGAVDVEGRPFAASNLGPPAFQQMGGKQPDLWAYADLGLLPEGSNPAYGSSLATMFTAGLAASMLSKCSSQEQIADLLKKQSCKIVRVP